VGWALPDSNREDFAPLVLWARTGRTDDFLLTDVRRN
jgi:hypothetical protein